MEIRNLITFVQVAELGSFTKAAKALDYSQSTISFQIKQLEAELNCLLFERINHTISLTEKGRELLDYARQISHLTEEFTNNAEVGNPKGLVRIAAPDSVCEELLNRDYADLRHRYPEISLKFINTDTDTMFRMLSQNEVDMILTLDRHIYQNEYIIAKEEPIRMHFVTGAASPYAKAEAVSIREIVQYPFILTEKRISYRRAFDEALAKLSLEILPVLEIGRTDIIIALLEAGMGVSFLPEFVTASKVAEGKLVYLNVTDVKADIWKQLIYHRNKWITRSLGVLIEYIKENEFGR